MNRRKRYIGVFVLALAAVGGGLYWGSATGKLGIFASTCDGAHTTDTTRCGAGTGFTWQRPCEYPFGTVGNPPPKPLPIHQTTNGGCEPDVSPTTPTTTTPPTTPPTTPNTPPPPATPPTTGGPAPTAYVIQANANDSEITAGESVTLTWSTDYTIGQMSLSSSPPSSADGILEKNGTVTVTPTQTTTYTFKGSGAAPLPSPQDVKVTVVPKPTTSTPTTTTGTTSTASTQSPTITCPSATTYLNSNQAASISFTAAHAKSIVASVPGVGTVFENNTTKAGGALPNPYSYTFYAGPYAENLTVTLTVTNDVGTATCKTGIYYAAPSLTAKASSTSISAGESIKLTWLTTNATSVSLAGYPTITVNNGSESSMTVTPTENSVYTFRASGPGGTASPVELAVTVAEPPTITCTSGTPYLNAGQAGTLTFRATHATKIQATDRATGAVLFSNSGQLPDPYEYTIYAGPFSSDTSVDFVASNTVGQTATCTSGIYYAAPSVTARPSATSQTATTTVTPVTNLNPPVAEQVASTVTKTFQNALKAIGLIPRAEPSSPVTQPPINARFALNTWTINSTAYEFSNTPLLRNNLGHTMRLVGTAKPGEIVTITVQSTPQTYTVTADSTGNWTYDVPVTGLDVASHTVAVSAPSQSNPVTLGFQIAAAEVVAVPNIEVVPLTQLTTATALPPSNPKSSASADTRTPSATFTAGNSTTQTSASTTTSSTSQTSSATDSTSTTAQSTAAQSGTMSTGAGQSTATQALTTIAGGSVTVEANNLSSKTVKATISGPNQPELVLAETTIATDQVKLTSQLPASLPAGDYTITLTGVEQGEQVSTPVTIVKALPVATVESVNRWPLIGLALGISALAIAVFLLIRHQAKIKKAISSTWENDSN